MSINMSFELIEVLVTLWFLYYTIGRIAQMKYGFWYSIVRYIRFGETTGLNWIINHFIYVLLLTLTWGEFTRFIGLLHQFMHPEEIDKEPIELLAGGFLITISVLLIVAERFQVHQVISFKKFYKTVARRYRIYRHKQVHHKRIV